MLEEMKPPSVHLENKQGLIGQEGDQPQLADKR